MTKDYIAYVRLTPVQKAGLKTICAVRPGTQAEHIRQAIAEYIDRTLPTLAHLPSSDPAAELITLREVSQ